MQCSLLLTKFTFFNLKTNINNKAYTIFISFIVALGGFLFGFEAGIISGVMSFAGPEFDLSEIQAGWVVSAPSFAAMFAMLFSGRISDIIGRKKTLIFTNCSTFFEVKIARPCNGTTL